MEQQHDDTPPPPPNAFISLLAWSLTCKHIYMISQCPTLMRDTQKHIFLTACLKGDHVDLKPYRSVVDVSISEYI